MTFVHANDAAMGDSGYDRRPADAYFTPPWCTRALIAKLTSLVGDWEHEEELWWEPACGDGAIAKVFRQHLGPDKVFASDLIHYGYGDFGRDFLQTTAMPVSTTSIVTNPPYHSAEKFVRHAIALTRETKGLVCMLLRNEWDAAKTRNDLFAARDLFAGKVVLTSRPRWIEDSAGSPRHNYAWFVWDHMREQLHHGRPPFVVYGHKDDRSE